MTKKKKSPVRISRVMLGRTINVGNYESVRIDLEADVPRGHHHVDVLNELGEELQSLANQINSARKCPGYDINR